MTPAALLAELRAAGFSVRVAGGRLLLGTPAGGALRPDDEAVIRAAKGELLRLLAWERAWADCPPDPPDGCPAAVALAGAGGAWAESLSEYQGAAVRIAADPLTGGRGDVPGAVPRRPGRRPVPAAAAGTDIFAGGP